MYVHASPADDRRVRIVVVGPDEPARELRELMLNPILEVRERRKQRGKRDAYV